MKISIIGAGAWGTAVALSSFRAGHSITLITKCQQDADEINADHENVTFFPGIKIPQEITVTHLYDSIPTADVLFLICPSAAVEDVCSHIHDLPKSTPIISFCKGLPVNYWKLPSMYIAEHFPENDFGVISGPSYAREVALGFPTRLVLASKNNCCKKLPISFSNMAILYSDDVVGVELGGCLKNIYAIGAGIFDGLKLGENSKCSYLTACIHEMVTIGSALGAQAESFFGPSGIGDLLATCTGPWSRNRTFGESITKDYDPQKLFNQSVAAIEGYRSVNTFHHIFEEKSINAPIVDAIYDILYTDNCKNTADMQARLLASVFDKK